HWLPHGCQRQGARADDRRVYSYKSRTRSCARGVPQCRQEAGPDRLSALAILFGAGFTVAVCLALGRLLLHDTATDIGLRFVAGSAVLSAAVFVVCAVGLSYPLVFAAGG